MNIPFEFADSRQKRFRVVARATLFDGDEVWIEVQDSDGWKPLRKTDPMYARHLWNTHHGLQQTRPAADAASAVRSRSQREDRA